MDEEHLCELLHALCASNNNHAENLSVDINFIISAAHQKCARSSKNWSVLKKRVNCLLHHSSIFQKYVGLRVAAAIRNLDKSHLLSEDELLLLLSEPHANTLLGISAAFYTSAYASHYVKSSRVSSALRSGISGHSTSFSLSCITALSVALENGNVSLSGSAESILADVLRWVDRVPQCSHRHSSWYSIGATFLALLSKSGGQDSLIKSQKRVMSYLSSCSAFVERKVGEDKISALPFSSLEEYDRLSRPSVFCRRIEFASEYLKSLLSRGVILPRMVVSLISHMMNARYPLGHVEILDLTDKAMAKDAEKLLAVSSLSILERVSLVYGTSLIPYFSAICSILEAAFLKFSGSDEEGLLCASRCIRRCATSLGRSCSQSILLPMWKVMEKIMQNKIHDGNFELGSVLLDTMESILICCGNYLEEECLIRFELYMISILLPVFHSFREMKFGSEVQSSYGVPPSVMSDRGIIFLCSAISILSQAVSSHVNCPLVLLCVDTLHTGMSCNIPTIVSACEKGIISLKCRASLDSLAFRPHSVHIPDVRFWKNDCVDVGVQVDASLEHVSEKQSRKRTRVEEEKIPTVKEKVSRRSSVEGEVRSAFEYPIRDIPGNTEIVSSEKFLVKGMEEDIGSDADLSIDSGDIDDIESLSDDSEL